MNDQIEILQDQETPITVLKVLLVAEDPGDAVLVQERLCKDEGVVFETEWIQKTSVALAGKTISSNETGT